MYNGFMNRAKGDQIGYENYDPDPRRATSGSPVLWGPGAVIAGAFLALWWIGSRIGLWTSYILPSPSAVGAAFLDLVYSGRLREHLLSSLTRIGMGFTMSSAVALPAGILMGLRPRLRRAISPLLEFMRHVPPLALLPLLILWFGIGEGSKLAVIALASFFPAFINAMEGVMGCDRSLVEVGHAFGLSEREIIGRIVLPYSLPYVLAGLRLALGYSWRSLIGAELLAASSGLGYMIQDAQAMSRPDVALVGIFVIGLVGIASDGLFRVITSSLLVGRRWGDDAH